MNTELDHPPVLNTNDLIVTILLGFVGIAIVIIGAAFGAW